MPTKGAEYVGVQLHPTEDADLIKLLARQPSKSAAIKKWIRQAVNMPAPVQPESAPGATTQDFDQIRQENADLRKLLQGLQQQIDDLPRRLAKDGYAAPLELEPVQRIDQNTRNKRIDRLSKANW